MTRLLLALCLTVPLAGQLSDAEKEDFLRTASVERTARLSTGITRPLRAALKKRDFVHDAHVQRVDESAPLKRLASGVQLNFRDYWGFNVAAYKLDRLLGLQMVPVSVSRKYRGDYGSFTWWVDDVAMMERERWEKDIEPPDRDAWNDQMRRARVFNQLTYNTDPNLGNVLIDKDWKIWLIDYTRAFRIQSSLLSREGLDHVDRRLLAKLRELDAETLQQELGEWLNRGERNALLERRDKIVAHFDEKIAAEGEAAVLYGEF